jgi:O-antigen biosynthesis protein
VEELMWPGVDISIVLATYDRPEMLVSCLNSLRAQVCERSFEVIVVDNHPQSGVTSRLKRQFEAADRPELRWLEEPERGLSRARNRGILAARGAVIVTTDDDVVAPPDWLGKLTVPLFEDRSGVEAVTGNCLPQRQHTEAERLFEAYGGLRHGEQARVFDPQWLAQKRFTFPPLWEAGTTANAAFRARLFQPEEIGLFDIRLGAGSRAGAWEDLDYFYRMLRGGFSIAYEPEASLWHCHRPDMEGLARQLIGYRRGEVAFLLLALVNYGDWRALGQLLYWIPKWRISMVIFELMRRARGRRQFSFQMMLAEMQAYVSGVAAFWEIRERS